MSKKFRLVTRSDMDGLVCAVILKQLNLIDEIKFVHPKDMQDGTITITNNDIITNLGRDAKIVSDENQRQAKFITNISQQFQHFFLHRNIQRRNRFISNQNFWFYSQCPGNANALPLTT